ncbi:MAG: Ig-like domain-containing protein [Roseiflexaceae bacterium]|nr:Ig-like domain-containing protein [Roseiflexaceae bacterium]
MMHHVPAPWRALMALILVGMLALSAIRPVYAASGAWVPSGDGDWDINAHWNPGPFPNGTNDNATFGAVNAGPATVTIRNTNITTNQITFDSAQPYTIVSTGGRTLTTRQINVASGAHTIAAPVLVPNNLIVVPAAGTRLTLARTIDNAFGRSLRLTGPGSLTLYLSGNNNPGGFIRSEAGAGRFDVYGAGRSAEIVYNANAAGGTLGIGETFGSTNGATGALLTVGGLILQPNVTIEFDLNGPDRGAATNGYDTLRFDQDGVSPNPNRNVQLNNATLTVRLGAGYVPDPGTTFTLIERTGGTGAILGTFASLPDGSVFTVDGLQFLLRYVTTGGITTSVTLARIDLPRIEAGSGNGQQATVGSVFATPLEVVVVGANGSPVEGVLVTFSAPTSGASALFPGGNTALTDANGRASVVVAANTVAGTYQVTATTSPSATTPAVFTLTNLAGAPDAIAATGGATQSAPVNAAFAAPLEVTVTDAYGNPKPGAIVTFSAPSSGASATFPAGATATTNAQGKASVTAVANGSAGSYQITAAVAGVATPAVFNLTNMGAPQLRMSIEAAPQAIAGTSFAYRLHYTNHGQAAAPGATLRILIPQGTTFSATGSAPGWTCTDGSPSGTLCTLSVTGPLAPGESGEAQFVVLVQPNPGVATIIMSVEIASGEANLHDRADDMATVERPVLYRLLLPLVAR